MVAGFGFLFMAFMVLLSIGTVVFWIWALVDCVQNEPDAGNDKLVWVLVIVLAGWIGALIYVFVRRPQRRAPLVRH